MKTPRILLLSLFCAAATASAQLITNFGSDATSAGSSGWSYNPTNSVLSGTETFGDIVYPSGVVSLDLSNSNAIQLTANATTAPTGLFTVSLEDGLGRTVASTFSWTSFNGGASVASLWSGDALFDASDVVGWTIDSGGSNLSINVTLEQLAAVPEPAAFGLLIPALVGGAAFIRRRRLARLQS